jgi:IMP dehydrogenase
MNTRITITDECTYDDVLIKPNLSTIKSRKHTDLSMKLTKHITLTFPIISSNMDTITEDKMAIAMAKYGGMGIIHRYCSIDDQVKMVKNVKRYTNHIITDPWTISKTESIENAINIIKHNKVGSLLVTGSDSESESEYLQGILTNRDINKYILNRDFYEQGHYMSIDKLTVADFMTTLPTLITYILHHNKRINNIDEQDILRLCLNHKIEQIPIIQTGKNKKILGLITLKDIIYRNKLKNSTFNLDINKQLIVGAAVGVVGDYMKRTDALISAGVNIICIDIAHGHHIICKQAIQSIKEKHPSIEIIAGNVCTKEGVQYLVEAGADCIKVGIGPGTICITRKQTGCGRPQLSAIIECGEMAKELGVTIIADGGHNRKTGNIFKAFCAGSSASMLGGGLGGTTETPGKLLLKDNKKVKMIRGMAGIISNYKKNIKLDNNVNTSIETMTPEGVEGYVEYKGDVKEVLHQISGGLRSGLSYIGCSNLEDVKHMNIEFIKITSSGLHESNSHGIKKM